MELVSFPVGDGEGVIVAELDDDASGLERISREPGQVVAQATQNLQSSLDQVSHLAKEVIHRMKAAGAHIDNVEIELGLRLHAEVGLVLAKTQAEGHLNLKVRWADADRERSGGE